MRGSAPRPAAPPPGRSPPPCAWPYAGPRRSSLLSWHAPSRSSGEGRTWRACLIPDLLALVPLSSHATARPGRLAPRSKARPHAAGRRFGSQPVGPHERYGTTAAPSGSIRRLDHHAAVRRERRLSTTQHRSTPKDPVPGRGPSLILLGMDADRPAEPDVASLFAPVAV